MHWSLPTFNIEAILGILLSMVLRQVPDEDMALTKEFFDVGEYHLVYEDICSAIVSYKIPITPVIFDLIEKLGKLMEYEDSHWVGLKTCIVKSPSEDNEKFKKALSDIDEYLQLDNALLADLTVLIRIVDQYISDVCMKRLKGYLPSSAYGLLYESLCELLAYYKIPITQETFDLIEKLGKFMGYEEAHWIGLKEFIVKTTL